MGDEAQYDGPLVSVTVEKTSTGREYAWKVVLNAADHSGKRQLGYIAEGTLKNLNDGPFEFALKVRDENRPVVTTMPASHRPDVRNAVKVIVKSALEAILTVPKAQ